MCRPSSGCSASQKDAAGRQWDRDWFGPMEGWQELAGAVCLGLPDEEGEAALGREETGGGGEDGGEALDGAEGDNAGVPEKSSARAKNTLISVNVMARMTSRRKVAFFWLDSISVTRRCGAQILMGRPGKPAPEPTSRRSGEFPPCRTKRDEDGAPAALLGKRWRAANRDSPKWRVTICSGSRMAVRLMQAFQRSSRSMYVDIFSSWDGERKTDSSLRSE